MNIWKSIITVFWVFMLYSSNVFSIELPELTGIYHKGNNSQSPVTYLTIHRNADTYVMINTSQDLDFLSKLRLITENEAKQASITPYFEEFVFIFTRIALPVEGYLLTDLMPIVSSSRTTSMELTFSAEPYKYPKRKVSFFEKDDGSIELCVYMDGGTVNLISNETCYLKVF